MSILSKVETSVYILGKLGSDVLLFDDDAAEAQKFRSSRKLLAAPDIR